MGDPLIDTPSAAGIEQALAVARRWLPAFVEGRRADDDVYADRVTTWLNIGEREAEIQRTPSRTRQVQAGADLRVEDVRLRVFDGGWVLQATTVGTNPDGAPVRLPDLPGGHLARRQDRPVRGVRRLPGRRRTLRRPARLHALPASGASATLDACSSSATTATGPDPRRLRNELVEEHRSYMDRLRRRRWSPADPTFTSDEHPHRQRAHPRPARSRPRPRVRLR